MAIIIAECPRCGDAIEIDTERAVVIAGTAESIWRVVRAQYREGDVINTQIVADLTFLHRTTVVRNLAALAHFGLVQPELKRPGGSYRQWLVAAKHPAKIARAIPSHNCLKKVA